MKREEFAKASQDYIDAFRMCVVGGPFIIMAALTVTLLLQELVLDRMATRWSQVISLCVLSALLSPSVMLFRKLHMQRKNAYLRCPRCGNSLANVMDIPIVTASCNCPKCGERVFTD